MKKLAITAIIASLLSTSSFADNQVDKFYFEAGGGVAKLESQLQSVIQLFSSLGALGVNADKAPDSKYGGGGIIEGEVGYSISPKMRLGFALRHYFKTSIYYSGDEERLEDKDFALEKEDDFIEGQSVSGGFLNAYYDLYQSDKINIFVHSGIGLNYVKSSFQKYGDEVELINKQWAFGLKGGLGASYAVTSNIVAQVKYEYSSLGEFFVKGTSQLGEDGEKEKLKKSFLLSSHAVIVGVRINI